MFTFSLDKIKKNGSSLHGPQYSILFRVHLVIHFYTIGILVCPSYFKNLKANHD